MLNKRTNILFEESTWQALSKVAKKRKSSIGSLIRDAVKNTYLNEVKQDKIKNAYQDIILLRKKHKNINYKELINYGREY